LDFKVQVTLIYFRGFFIEGHTPPRDEQRRKELRASSN
jgi:hypothetical protein